jgi:hypothetical protein
LTPYHINLAYPFSVRHDYLDWFFLLHKEKAMASPTKTLYEQFLRLAEAIPIPGIPVMSESEFTQRVNRLSDLDRSDFEEWLNRHESGEDTPEIEQALVAARSGQMPGREAEIRRILLTDFPEFFS